MAVIYVLPKTTAPEPAERETPEEYYRARAAYWRSQGYVWVAAVMDRLADNCAALAAEFEAAGDDYVPF